MKEFFVPAGPGASEYVEKRSRFLGLVRRVETEDEARKIIAEVKKQHYDARHNCWCYGIRGGAQRYSDDGEPQGTAGIPMLEVFKREGIENFVCVVTRYFGGVLLGAGGLLRAYTKAAGDALYDGGIAVIRRWVTADIGCAYNIAERVKRECESAGGIVSHMEYGAAVTVKVLVPEEILEDFSLKIVDATQGAAACLVTGEELRAVPIKLKK